MRIGRLKKRQREQLPVMVDLVAEIERQLDSVAFDAAEPSLEPAIGEARHHAGRLKAFLSELQFLSESEHSENRW